MAGVPARLRRHHPRGQDRHPPSENQASIEADLRGFLAGNLDLEGEPIGLFDAWQGSDEVIVVDAVSSGAPPGLADTIELERTLARLPPRLTIYGIEGERFGAGDKLSALVRAAVDGVREELRRKLGKSAADGRPRCGILTERPVPGWGRG